MASKQSYKSQPVNRVTDRLSRLILTAMNKALLNLPEELYGESLEDAVSSVPIATRTLYRWAANGFYFADTSVDGAWIAPTSFTVKAVWVHRLTAGTSSNTIVDVHKNGSTIYSTQANRPTIEWDDADLKVQASLPDVTSVTAGDILTMDIDQAEAGRPAVLTLVIEGE